MKNVIKATVIATAVAASGAAMAAEDWSSISNELGKYGINLTADAIETQVMGDSGFEINSHYNSLLKAQDAVSAAEGFAAKAAALATLSSATTTWSSNGGKKVQSKDSANFVSDWDDWAAGLIENRVTEIIDTDVADYLDDIDSATGGTIDAYVDGTIDDDNDKVTKATGGINVLVYVAGGAKAAGVKDNTASNAENSDDYAGRRITEFMADLDSTLTSDATSDDITTAFKGNVTIGGEYFEQNDFTFAKNSDGDYEIDGISGDFLTDHSISNKAAFKVELYDLSATVDVSDGIYSSVTLDDDSTFNVQLSDYID